MKLNDKKKKFFFFKKKERFKINYSSHDNKAIDSVPYCNYGVL